jgi:hypothetical protein
VRTVGRSSRHERRGLDANSRREAEMSNPICVSTTATQIAGAPPHQNAVPRPCSLQCLGQCPRTCGARPKRRGSAQRPSGRIRSGLVEAPPYPRPLRVPARSSRFAFLRARVARKEGYGGSSRPPRPASRRALPCRLIIRKPVAECKVRIQGDYRSAKVPFAVRFL